MVTDCRIVFVRGKSASRIKLVKQIVLSVDRKYVVLLAKSNFKLDHSNTVHLEDHLQLGLMWKGERYIDKVLSFGMPIINFFCCG